MRDRLALTSLCLVPLISACSAMPGMPARSAHHPVEVQIASINCATLQSSAWQVGLTDEVWSRNSIELALSPAVGMDFVEQATGNRPATAPRLELGVTPQSGAPYLLLASTDGTQPQTWRIATDQRPEDIRYMRSGGWYQADGNSERGHYLSLVVDNRSALERALNLGQDEYDVSATPSCMSNR